MRIGGGTAYVLMFLLGSAVGCVPVSAAGTVLAELNMEQARDLKQSGRILPLEDLLKAIRKDYPGQVIEVELEEENGRLYYEIEVLDKDGVVRELDVDAATGEILEVEIEDDD